MELILKPWGSEEILSHTSQYVMKKMRIKPGHRMSLQFHKVKEETIYVVEGRLLIWESRDSTPKKLSPGEVYHVTPNQVHRFGADDRCPVVLIECSTTELDDVVRIEDDYSRS